MPSETSHAPASNAPSKAAQDQPFGGKAIVLVGLMGAGKTTVGRRLANRLGLPFVDADAEVEAAAGLTIPEIFEAHGEPAFRDGERKVIARLLSNGPQVLATGGGAFMNPETRACVRDHGVSVWLKADLDVLMRRVGKRPTRPLLKSDNPRAVMEKLMRERNPIYAEADIALETGDGPHEDVVDRLMTLLEPLK